MYKRKKLEFSISNALNENCRDIMGDYSLNTDKFICRIDKAEYLLEDLPIKNVLFPSEPFISRNDLNNMRNVMQPIIDAFDIPETSSNLILSYVFTLKIKQLISDNSKNNFEKLRDFYDFMINKVDIISLVHWGTAILCFGGLKLKSGKNITKLIHITKKKNISKRDSYIRGIWNAALDLAWVIDVCQEIKDNNKTPIFVTNDAAVNEIMKRYTLRMFIKGVNNMPALAEFDLSETNFDDRFVKELNLLEKDLMTRQKNGGPIKYFKNKRYLGDEIPKRLIKIKEELEELIPMK